MPSEEMEASNWTALLPQESPFEMALKSATSWALDSDPRQTASTKNVIFTYFFNTISNVQLVKCDILKLNGLYTNQSPYSISVPNFRQLTDKHKK